MIVECSIYLDIPDGFMVTGEFRAPKKGDWFLTFGFGEWSATQATYDMCEVIPKHILKKTKNGKEKTKQAKSSIREVPRKKTGK